MLMDQSLPYFASNVKGNKRIIVDNAVFDLKMSSSSFPEIFAIKV